MDIRVVASLPLVLLVSTAHSAELATRSAVRDLQVAEQIIAASVTSQDLAELKRQEARLLAIGGRITDSEDLGIRMGCLTAIATLKNLAADLADPASGRKAVSAARERRLYLEAMPLCEKDVGLSPPSAPSLR